MRSCWIQLGKHRYSPRSEERILLSGSPWLTATLAKQFGGEGQAAEAFCEGRLRWVTRRRLLREYPLVPVKNCLAEEECDDGTTHEKGPERDIIFPLDDVCTDQSDSDNRPQQ